MSIPKTLVVFALVCACGPTVATPADDGTTTSGDDSIDPTTSLPSTTDPSTTIPGTTENPTSPTTATTIDPDDTSAEDSSSTTIVCTSCCDFICIPDGGGADDGGCDVWAQDCPDGEKCMPWSNDGDKYWDSSRCSPLDDTPRQIGDACVVQGSGVSGLDDCDLGLMCFWVDPITGEGTCVANCSGSEANPTCADPATTCVIDFEGAITLCLPACDPLLQDCAQGTCSPYGVHEAEGFACGAPLPPLVLDGEPCEHDWECGPGSMCPSGDEAPACDDGPCCTPLCAIDDPQACVDGFVCTQLLPDSPLPGSDLVGYCALP